MDRKVLPKTHLRYKFGFWLAKEAATCNFTIKRVSPQKYIVKLEGETKGSIGFFLNYRKDVMISEMIYSEKLHRFIPEKFTKRIIIGKNFKQSIYVFDYKNMRILKRKKKITVIQNDNSPEKDFLSDLNEDSYPKKIIKTSSYTIPLKHKTVDDYLTASLNFFIGAYGIPSKNNSVKIRLFPEKSKKKRNRIIEVKFSNEKNGLTKLLISLNVDFISDKIKKAFVFMGNNMIPEKVLIPTGTIIGTLYAERIDIEKE